MRYVKFAVPEPQPIARIPAFPPLSENWFGPPGCGPASDPMRTIDLGFFRGSVPFTFFKSTVDAAPISLTILCVTRID